MKDLKELIEYSEFVEIEKKLDVRYGYVVAAERIPKTTKLLKLTVSFDWETLENKTAVTNLGAFFEPEIFVGETFPFVVNLVPSTMRGVTSEVMIMVGTGEEIELYNFTRGAKLI